MNSRERLRAIIAGCQPDRCGLWLGNPHPDTWPLYLEALQVLDQESLRMQLQDDFRWIRPDHSDYRHPEGKPIFDFRRLGSELSVGGAFAHSEEAQEVEEFEWPDPDFLDFSQTIEELDQAGEVYRASGFWCPFFHEVANFLGMENYFVKMYTHPDLVHAVTRHVVDFYLEANRRFFAAAGDRVDAFFFGNDFGSQRDLLIGPRQFDEFIRPYMQDLIDLARGCGYQVILHSCGSVYRLIPRLLDMGVDAMHPLQARAAHMDAETLAREFKGRLAFIGGIDTQELLVHGTPAQVKADVRRVKALLGPGLVVSPSHEALLPNVPAANVQAMAEAALEA